MRQLTLPSLKAKHIKQFAFFAIPVSILLFVIIFSFVVGSSQQFSYLAQAFVHGHLNFLSSIGGKGQDPVLYHGRIYWDDGPFPAVVLMPFVAFFNLFHIFFNQDYLQWALVIGILFFIYKLAKILSYSAEDSLLLALGFAIGSVFIGVAVIAASWYFAQIVTTFLLFWSIYEFYTHKRWWLIGTICGLIFLTRATADPIIIFFALELLSDYKQRISKLKNLAVLFLPVLMAVIIQGTYNFVRFHNPLNGGFEYQLISRDSAEARSMGIFSFKHIPTNLYSMLFRGPVPVIKDSTSWSLKFPYMENNSYGMSIFFTSPYLLYIFTNKWSSFDKHAKNLIISTLITGLFVLSYYGIGIEQFGYRYMLDFMPELFLLFMIMYKKSHKRITFGMKALIIGSGILNFYLLCTFI
ncbi:MAG TPA: hypothetical protein VII94_01140 [Candidatus Saccharimonadales bacterium]